MLCLLSFVVFVCVCCMFSTFFPNTISEPRHPLMPHISLLSHITISPHRSHSFDPRCRHCWREYVSMATVTKPTVAKAQGLCAGEKCWCQGESVYSHQQRCSLHLNKAGDSFIITASSVDRGRLIYSVYAVGSVKGRQYVCVCVCVCVCVRVCVCIGGGRCGGVHQGWVSRAGCQLELVPAQEWE